MPKNSEVGTQCLMTTLKHVLAATMIQEGLGNLRMKAHVIPSD